jgi:hypothetical protein
MLAASLIFLRDEEQSGAVPHPEYRNRIVPLAKQSEALQYLEDWVKLLNEKFEQHVALEPHFLASPPAAALGLKELVIDLACLWRSRSGNIELTVGQNSRWIRFLQQALRIITQRDIGSRAADKLTQRAVEYSKSDVYKWVSSLR